MCLTTVHVLPLCADCQVTVYLFWFHSAVSLLDRECVSVVCWCLKTYIPVSEIQLAFHSHHQSAGCSAESVIRFCCIAGVCSISVTKKHPMGVVSEMESY